MEYLVTIHAKLFTVNRVVYAESKFAAANQVDQTGALWVSIEPAIFEE